MSCYRPLVAQFIAYDDEHKPMYKLQGMNNYLVSESWKDDPRNVAVPCGHCVGCRLDYSRRWADRCMIELDHSKKAVFCTLTYDNEHLPVVSSNDGISPDFPILSKRDVQLFLKRLRKHFPDKEIRYFLCGEYGEQNGRPHYHAILFGLGLDDLNCILSLFPTQSGEKQYSSQILSDLWHNGKVSISPVSWKTAAYTARYSLKKSLSKDVTCNPEFVKEFSMQSRKPAIGAYYAFDHPDCFADDDLPLSYIPVFDSSVGSKRSQIPVPKVVIESLRKTNPELYQTFKEQRSKYANDLLLLELHNQDKHEVNYLSDCAVSKRNKIERLSRSFNESEVLP